MVLKNQINNQYFENLFNYSNVPVIIWDKEFNITRFNPAFEKLTGRKEETLIGKSIEILFPESKVNSTMQIFRDAEADCCLEDTEIEIIHENGFVSTVIWNSALVLDIEGSTHIATVAQGQDITKRKQSEKDLQKSEHLLKESQKVSKIGSYVLEISEGTWRGSEELDRIFGISANDEHSVESWISIVHPEHKKMMTDYLTLEVIGKKMRFDKEYKIINQKTQEVHWVNGIGELEFDGNNIPIKMTGTIQDISERKKIEEALTNSEQSLKSFVQDSLLCIYFLNTETKKISYANPSFCQLLGYFQEEIENLTIYNFLNHPKESVDSFLNHVIQTKQRNIGERQWKDKNGNVIDMLVNASYCDHKDSNIIYISALDISERKKVEKALFESEERLKRGEMIAKFGNWKLVLDEQIVYSSSEGSRKIYGTDKSELSLADVKKFMLPEYRKKMDEALNTLIFEGKPYDVEFEIKRGNDGKVVDIHSIAEYDPESKIIFGVVQDITERKRAQQEIIDSEKKFKSVLQSAKDSIVLANNIGEIIFWNHFAEKIFGYPENEVLGKPLTFIMPERYRAAHHYKFSKPLSNKEAEIIENTVELHGLKKNGNEFPIELSISHWTNENGKFYCGIIRDVTERKNAEEEQKKYIQKLSEIAFMQSHHVRAPIASILGLLELINFEKPEDPKNIEVFDHLKKTTIMCDVVIKEIIEKTSEIEKLSKTALS